MNRIVPLVIAGVGTLAALGLSFAMNQSPPPPAAEKPRLPLEGELVGRPGLAPLYELSDGKGVLTTLAPRVRTGQTLRWHARKTDAGAEVAISAGAAEIGPGKVLVEAGKVSVAGASAEKAPHAPTLSSPPFGQTVDASSGGVNLAWNASPGAAKYRVQLAKLAGSGLGATVLDETKDGTSAQLPVKEAGSYAVRVAGIDAAGNVGAFGLPRPFHVGKPGEPAAAAAPAALPAALPTAPPDAPPAPTPAEPPPAGAATIAAKVSGPLTKGGAALKGAVNLVAGDVIAATGAGSLAFDKALFSLNGGGEARVVGAEADGAGMKVVIALQKGGGAIDASGSGSVVALAIQSGGTTVETRGGKARVDVRGGDLRVSGDRGEVTVAAGGATARVGAGQLLDVSGGALGAVLTPPKAPSLTEPADGKAWDVEGGIPDITFAWKAVDGATKYRFVVAKSKGLGDPIFEQTVEGTELTTGTLKQGRWFWGVQAIGAGDVTGPASTRGIALEKDTKPPPLSIGEPADGSTTTEERITIAGRTAPGAKVKVNLKEAEVGEDGSFSASVALLPGPNSITVEAVGGNGQGASRAVKINRE